MTKQEIREVIEFVSKKSSHTGTANGDWVDHTTEQFLRHKDPVTEEMLEAAVEESTRLTSIMQPHPLSKTYLKRILTAAEKARRGGDE